VCSTWDLAALMRLPVVQPAPGFHQEGVEAILFEGLLAKNKPTKVFAW
jgi:hypothetical protein